MGRSAAARKQEYMHTRPTRLIQPVSVTTPVMPPPPADVAAVTSALVECFAEYFLRLNKY